MHHEKGYLIIAVFSLTHLVPACTCTSHSSGGVAYLIYLSCNICMHKFSNNVLHLPLYLLKIYFIRRFKPTHRTKPPTSYSLGLPDIYAGVELYVFEIADDIFSTYFFNEKCPFKKIKLPQKVCNIFKT